MKKSTKLYLTSVGIGSAGIFIVSFLLGPHALLKSIAWFTAMQCAAFNVYYGMKWANSNTEEKCEKSS